MNQKTFHTVVFLSEIEIIEDQTSLLTLGLININSSSLVSTIA